MSTLQSAIDGGRTIGSIVLAHLGRSAVIAEHDARSMNQYSSTDTKQTSEKNAYDQQTSLALVMIALESDLTRKILGAGLRRIGISSALYSNGVTLLNALHTERTPPTLVILELNLPKLDSEHVIHVLRTQERFRSTRIVLVFSERTHALTRLFSRLKKMDAYLSSPIVQEHFVRDIVDRYIEPSRRHEDVEAARIANWSAE